MSAPSTPRSSFSLSNPATPTSQHAPDRGPHKLSSHSRSNSIVDGAAAAPPRVRSISDPDPATEHVFVVTPGQRIGERYEIVKLIGRGTFSQVVMCRDLLAVRADGTPPPPLTGHGTAAAQAAGMVAIKVVRDVARYRHAAEKEARILQHLANRPITSYPIPQPPPAPGQALNSSGGVNPLLGWFRLGGHMCLVFPVLGCSLYDFLRANHFRPFFPHHIKHIGQQLLQTTTALHDLTVIHADIKPENILLVDASYTTLHIENMNIHVPLSTDIRMVDFGTAVYDSHEKPAIVVSRSYRPPEVVLGLEWSYGVDIWAIGCVLMELYAGHRLFSISGSTGTDSEHIVMMEQMLGPLPAHMKNRSRLFSGTSPHLSTRYLPSPAQSPLNSPMNSPRDPSNANHSAMSLHQQTLTSNLPKVLTLRERVVQSDVHFFDLITRMLTYDPAMRISARDCLKHPYFTQQ